MFSIIDIPRDNYITCSQPHAKKKQPLVVWGTTCVYSHSSSSHPSISSKRPWSPLNEPILPRLLYLDTRKSISERSSTPIEFAFFGSCLFRRYYSRGRSLFLSAPCWCEDSHNNIPRISHSTTQQISSRHLKLTNLNTRVKICEYASWYWWELQSPFPAPKPSVYSSIRSRASSQIKSITQSIYLAYLFHCPKTHF